MNDLQRKASELRSTLPKTGGGTAPVDQGIRLATFPRPEGELRLSWNVYEDRPYLRFQLWSKSDDGSFWPVKGQGLTVKVKELPDLAEGVSRALDMALKEGGGTTSKPRTESRAYEGEGAPF
jgi:hypothetical protein